MSSNKYSVRSSLRDGQSLSLSPKRTFRFLVGIIVGLSLVNFITRLPRLLALSYPLDATVIGLFNVDREGNVPSIFSSLILLFCAVLLGKIARIHQAGKHRYAKQWKALAILFLFLSLDELFGFHELLIPAMRSLFRASGIFYFAWVIPGALFVVICLLAFLKLITALPPATKRLFLLAGTLFVSGCLGLELVGGYLKDASTQNYSFMLEVLYLIETTLEECLEMLGTAVFVYALLSYIASHLKGAIWRVQVPEAEQ